MLLSLSFLSFAVRLGIIKSTYRQYWFCVEPIAKKKDNPLGLEENELVSVLARHHLGQRETNIQTDI